MIRSSTPLRCRIALALALAGALSLVPGTIASADEPDELDAIGFDETGFDDTGAEADDVGFGTGDSAPHSEPEPENVTPSPWSYAGLLKHRAGLWTERFDGNPFATARQSLDLSLRYDTKFMLGAIVSRLRLVATGHGEYDFAYLYDRSSYARSTRDAYEYQLFPKDSFAAITLDRFDLGFGFQTFNWGQGEVLSLLDVINPRDYREPGITDPEDLRLAVLSTHASVQLDRHRLEVVAIHQSWFGLFAPPLGTFSPFRKLLLEHPVLGQVFEGRDLTYDHRPSQRVFDAQATQFVGRWSMSTPSLDMAWTAGSVLEPLGVPSLPEAAAFDAPTIAVPLAHPRYEFVGYSGVIPWGPLLLRWELKIDVQRPIPIRRLDSDVLELSGTRRDQAGAMFGLTYVAGAFNGSVEVTRAFLLGSPLDTNGERWTSLWPVEAPQLALRTAYRFLRDRASIQIIGLILGIRDWNSALLRAQLGYNLTEDLEAHLGAIVYLTSDDLGYFYGFDRHDRVFAGLRWSFASR